MKRATITLSDELEAAVTSFQEDQAVPPSLATIARMALREYLAARGYLVPTRERRVLRLTPVPLDADEATTVSREHNRFLAQE